LSVLADKPEETVESTLKALWLTAAGDPKSVEAAAISELPSLDPEQEQLLSALIAKRLKGVPLAHITGYQQFMGVELLTSPEALIPRKETEILGRKALKLLNELADQQDEILLMDICTGAGNLIISLSTKVPKVRGYAADLSVDAVRLAKKNVSLHQLQDRVDVHAGDLLSPFDNDKFHHRVDILLCNPPYISSGRVSEMAQEISEHEPCLAFDGGPFGIKILNALMKQATQFLRPGGWLMFEVGLGQGRSIIKRMEKIYSNVQTACDENGEIRVVMGQM
jgi:release factor glutamine methyltransferase